MSRIINGITLSVLLIAGCNVTADEPAKAPPPPKKESKSIFGKKTQDIGKFDPDAGRQVSDSKVRITSPLFAGLEAYGPLMEQVSKMGVDRAVQVFYALQGRYPKDYDEFMSEIIKKNNMRLPVLPAGAQYQYDEQNHKLVVVKAEEPQTEKKSK